MADPVVLVKAAPIPWRNRNTISQNPDPASPHNIEERVKRIIPALNSFLIPDISPQRPTGSMSIAVESRKEVTIQLSDTAFRLKSSPIAGSAILIEEIRNVPIKEVTATTAIRDICRLFHSIHRVLNQS
jgi:hypothetical protein